MASTTPVQNSKTSVKSTNVHQSSRKSARKNSACKVDKKKDINLIVQGKKLEKCNVKPSNHVVPQQNESKITLEKVAEDMTNILAGLRNQLHEIKVINKTDSFSDVNQQLEVQFKKSTSRRVEIPCAESKNGKSTTICSKKGKKDLAKKSNTSSVAKHSRRSSKTSTSSKDSKVSHKSSNPKTAYPVKPLTLNSNELIREIYPLRVLKEEVVKAIRQRQTFTIKGHFNALRNILLRRGWVEKLCMNTSSRHTLSPEMRKYQYYSIKELVAFINDRELGPTARRLIKSKMLANHQVDLYWSYNLDGFKETSDAVKLTLLNKVRRGPCTYTCKEGLCEAITCSYWFQIPGVSKINHPRTYRLTKDGDTVEFIRDFQLTAAMSLLKWIVQNSTTHECVIVSNSGRVPLKFFDFAVNECYKYVKRAKHEDIDQEIQESTEYEWNEFLENYYKTVHTGNHFKASGDVTEKVLLRKATYILKKIEKFWTQIDLDGIMNIWILKPMRGTRGIGIHVCRTLEYILKVVKENKNRRYIIQKYVERPFLIHNTKCDIRQWFLISCTMPLTIWIYRESYIRFSSQTYNLRKLHESIHITNNSIQSKYQHKYTTHTRDVVIPSYNMWDSNQFKSYLSDIGYPKAYDEIIYPGMKQCITAAVLIHQDKLDTRKNSFEFYGADFVLTEDFRPWLLEINNLPALNPSTPVTARMCPIVLEDVIRVVVDYDRNKNASTGKFELAYKQRSDALMKKSSHALSLSGTPLEHHYFKNEQITKTISLEQKSTISMVVDNPDIQKAKESLKKVTEGMRDTLQNLLLLVKKERQRRDNLKTVGTVLSKEILLNTPAQTMSIPV